MVFGRQQLPLENRREFRADFHPCILRRFDFAAAHSDGSREIQLTGAQQTAEENHSLGSHGPHRLAFVDGRHAVDLHSHITGRIRTAEAGNSDLRCADGQQGSVELLVVDTEMYRCHFGQRSNTSLEVHLLSGSDISEIGCQRHGRERTDEDVARCYARCGHHIVGTLTKIGEKAALQQQTHDSFSVVDRQFKVLCYLYTIGLNANTQELTAFAALYRGDGAAHRRNNFHLFRRLVDKQRGTDEYSITNLDQHLGSHPAEVGRSHGILSRRGYFSRRPVRFTGQSQAQSLFDLVNVHIVR